MRKRGRSSIVVGMAALLLVVSPAWPDSLTSTVADPVGDLSTSYSCAPLGCPPYQDIVRGEIAKRGGMFLLGMTVAAEIPVSPPLQPAVKQIVWDWPLNTDLETFPAGFPFVPAVSYPAEFIVEVVWDGTLFTAHVIDRRPLLAGGQAVVTPVPFKIKGADITVVVDESLIADPSSFRWHVFTLLWTTESGTNSAVLVDTAPEEPPGPTWPS